MFAAPVDEPFDSPRHAFEVAWDGLRTLAFVDQGRVRLQDLYGRNVTALFPELSAAADYVSGSGHVLDGEIVSLGEEGRPEFEVLKTRLTGAAGDVEQLADVQPVVFQAFDILYRDGRRVMNEPLRTRKRMLKQVVRRFGQVAVPDHVEGDGVAFFEAARQHDLAGMVAKELESPYVSGLHSRAWQLVKVYPKDNFVIGGFTYGGPTRVRAGPHRGPPFHSLLVGQYDRWGQLHFLAEVTGGFCDDDVEHLAELFEGITTTNCPFNKAAKPERLVFWCEPVISVTVAYSDRTGEGNLRFPKFETLRLDVPAESCRIPKLLPDR
jgi:DNA ligase D-like protein (predicted ligase)